MKKNRQSKTIIYITFLFVLLLFVGWSVLKPSFFQKRQGSIFGLDDSFNSIPIVKFTRPGIPCIRVNIEGRTVLAELDLGMRGELSFSSDFLKNIDRKEYIHERTFYGIKGIEHVKKLYKLPSAMIGGVSFNDPMLYEETLETLSEASFLKDSNDIPSIESGRVGWQIFRNKNLFLDLENSIIATCKNLNMLKGKGYFPQTFIKVPLLTDRGLLEFYATLPSGPIRCMIDTGASKNVINTELQDGQTIEEAVWDPRNTLKYPWMKIGEHPFGPLSFLQIPIQIPIPIEAILGVEFLSKHLVFFDFSEGFVYFGTKPK